MSQIRKWIRFLFGFSRTETNGFIILLPLLFLILFSEPIYRWATSLRNPDVEDDQKILDSLVAEWSASPDIPQAENDDQPVEKNVLFSFDPNKASIDDFKDLGFPEKLAGRISKFRSKGGVFRVKSDLLRVYGMDSVLYRRLFSYIRLPEKYQRETFRKETVKENPVAKFDLNEADTSQLKKIFGVGDRLAARIISYRQKLGGFVSALQLREVYGLDTAVIRRIQDKSYIIESFTPVRLNINGSSDRELSAHPYISTVIAKAIVAYRFQHGDFASVEEIRSLHILKKEEADKIIPYLSVNH